MVLYQMCFDVFACAFSELTGKSDLFSLNGKTLSAFTSGVPSEAPSSNALLCPYVNLQLVNAQPAGKASSLSHLQQGLTKASPPVLDCEWMGERGRAPDMAGHLNSS